MTMKRRPLLLWPSDDDNRTGDGEVKYFDKREEKTGLN